MGKAIAKEHYYSKKTHNQCETVQSEMLVPAGSGWRPVMECWGWAVETMGLGLASQPNDWVF